MSRTPVTDEIRYLIRHLKARSSSVRNLCASLQIAPQTLANIQNGTGKNMDRFIYDRILEHAEKLGIQYQPGEDEPAAGKLGAVGNDLTDPDSDPYVTFAPETDEEHTEEEDGFNDPLFQALITAWNRIPTVSGRYALIALAFQTAEEINKES